MTACSRPETRTTSLAASLTTAVRANPDRPLALPPLAFEGKAGACGAVERVEFRDVLRREREVEQLGVLCDPVAVGGFGYQRNLALDALAEQHLGGCAPEALRDLGGRFAGKVAAVSQRAVGLERDAVLPACVQ